MRIYYNLSSFLLLCFVILSLQVYQVSAQEAKFSQDISLDECVQLALENHWSIKLREEKIEQAYYVKKQAKADFLPKLSTDYGYTRMSEVYTNSFTGIELNSKDNYRWATTITQPIFTGFKLTGAYELAKLGIDQSAIELELEKLDLILRVKRAYFDVLKAEKGVEVAKSAVDSLGSNMNVAQSFYDLGMIPVNDLLKVEVELSNSQNELTKVLNISQLMRASLNLLMSRPISQPVNLEDVLGYEEENFDFETYLTMALANRPEIKAIDVNNMQVDEQIKIAKSNYFPEVAFTYSYIKEGTDPLVSGSDFHDEEHWQAMAGLSWTFWDWKKTGNRVLEQKSFKKQLLQTRKGIENEISLQVKNAVLDIEETLKNIPTSKKAVLQAEENLRVNQERYKAQVTTSTEVLDAQTLLTQAKVNYYSALYNNKIARAALIRAVGYEF